MSTVRLGEAVNECSEVRKEIRKIKYLIVHLYIMLIVWVVRLLGVAELGGAVGAEVNVVKYV